jgi:hypothetical protein
MRVDLNNIRKILLNDYRDLCLILNESIKTNGLIKIEANDIKAQMDSLRLCLAILAATEFKECDDFQAIGEQELPILSLPQEKQD